MFGMGTVCGVIMASGIFKGLLFTAGAGAAVMYVQGKH
jgi:hypothetical protein